MFKAVAASLVLVLGPAWSGEAPLPQMVVQLGHTTSSNYAAVTPDGRFALSAGGNAVILWDLASGAQLRTFPAPGSSISAMALRRDGKAFAGANYEGEIWLVDLERGKELRRFQDHAGPVWSVAFSGDGTRLATAGSDQATRLWDLETGGILRTFKGDFGVSVVALSPDGHWLASGDSQTPVRLWSLPDGTERAALGSPEAKVTALAFSPDSTRLAGGGEDQSVRLWDLGTFRELQAKKTASKVNAVAFSPDGRLLAAATGKFPQNAYATYLWDANSGREERILSGHGLAMECLAFAPDGKRLLTGRRQGLTVWDPALGTELLALMGHASAVRYVQFSPDGRLLATAQNDGTARLWDLALGAEVRAFRGQGIAVSSVAFSPDGRTLATSSFDCTARLWDLATGAVRETFTGHDKLVDRVAFSVDGRFLFTSSMDKTIRKWKVTGGPVRAFHGVSGQSQGVTVSPDGRNLAAVGRNLVLLRSAETGEEGQRLEFAKDVTGAAFSPDGTRLLVACEDHQAYLLDLASGQVVRSFTLGSEVGAAAFSADGTRIALGGWNGETAVFDASTGATVSASPASSDEIDAITFSPDGTRYACAGWGGGTQLRETATGRELARIFSLDKGWVVLTPDGHFDGSPEGLKAIRWTVGLQSFPLEAFSEGYFVPSLLPRILSGERLVRQDDVSQGFKLPPRVRILAPADGASTQDGEVDVRVEAVDQGGGIDEIRLYLNGKAVAGEARGVKVAPGALRTEVFRVALVDGENRLKAVALSSARIESNPGEISLQRRGPAAQATLHVLAVGIDHYRNGAMDLNFARADAGAVATFFTTAPQGLFRQVDARRLFDAQATKAAILAAFEGFRSLPPQDVAVIYLAGHGEALENTWYFLPFELTYPEREAEVRSKGLSSLELQEAVRNIGAQKVLVLLDACKSGEALASFGGRGVEDRKALSMLARATGVHIIAASTKDQLASEVKELGHGVFTYTLLQGLQGGAGEAGQVTVRRLLAYVESHLPEVSQKYRAQAQYPVVDSRGMDFPLAVGH